MLYKKLYSDVAPQTVRGNFGIEIWSFHVANWLFRTTFSFYTYYCILKLQFLNSKFNFISVIGLIMLKGTLRRRIAYIFFGPS